MSFATRVALSKALVYDVRAPLADECRYFIVEIDPAKHAAFRRALEHRESFRLEGFGTILHCAWGEPDDELKADLNRRFGMYSDGND